MRESTTLTLPPATYPNPSTTAKRNNRLGTHGSPVGLARLERIRELAHALRALYRILVDILRWGRAREHPQLTIGDMIKRRGVDLEVLREDFFGDVRHPVRNGEGRVL